jgi:hypothetical protein
MARLIAQTPWSLTKSTTTVSVTLSQPATAGSTLVLFAAGGAQVTAKITNSSGAAFSLRSQALGTQAASISDFVAVGGETTVFLTLNGAENVAGVIYEIGSLGAFIAASNNGTGVAPSNANDLQSAPTSSINVASGSAVLIAGWTVIATAATTPFSLTNQWRQMGPLGKLYVNNKLQPGANTQFIYASGIADVTSASRYPASLTNSGDYRATSTWIASSTTTFAVQAAYADASGIATNPSPANAIMAENSLPGTINGNWFGGNTATDSTIAGYCDKTSYLPGNTVNFKVDSTSFPFRVEIYRLGYYGWETFGARNVLGNGAGYITGTVTAQPAPTVDATLGSTSCGWTTNATWTIPSTAPPGIYYVLFRRTDVTTHVASGHFIVGSASTTGMVAVCLPDMTYQAYNVWGATTNSGTLSAGTWTGRSLYTSGSDGATGNFAHRAYAVSFDRPYSTQQTQANTYFFDAEQGVIMFLEAQGYNLTYCSNIDLENNTTLLNTASLVCLLGHHEYWSQNVYNCLTNSVNAGVNMMIASSNTALWHTRFAASDANKRTMICYKDSGTADVSAGWSGTGYDPISYTGTWRDARTNVGTVNNTDIRRENALTGQLFVASAPINVALTIPFAQKTLPIWRNSASIQALTSGQSYTTPTSVGGNEIDSADGSSGQPSNLVSLSPTTMSTTTGSNAAGTIYNTSLNPTVGFTLYRRASGALVFNTGAWRGWQGVSRWAQSSIGSVVTSVDVNWQNALLALLYDLGITPIVVRELRPGTDTALTNPATGAIAGGRSAVALAYGLRAPSDGDFMVFFS